MTTETKAEQNFIKRVLITVSIVLLMLLFVILIYLAIDVVLLVFAAVLLAIFLHGLANLLGRYTKLSEGWSVLLVSLILLAILAGAISLLAPSVAEEIRH
ncbi:MAG TPA: hypothetical protein VGD05_03480, partial [Pyrinomonadaceae bacterium]